MLLLGLRRRFFEINICGACGVLFSPRPDNAGKDYSKSMLLCARFSRLTLRIQFIQWSEIAGCILWFTIQSCSIWCFVWFSNGKMWRCVSLRRDDRRLGRQIDKSNFIYLIFVHILYTPYLYKALINWEYVREYIWDWCCWWWWWWFRLYIFYSVHIYCGRHSGIRLSTRPHHHHNNAAAFFIYSIYELTLKKIFYWWIFIYLFFIDMRIYTRRRRDIELSRYMFSWKYVVYEYIARIYLCVKNGLIFRCFLLNTFDVSIIYILKSTLTCRSIQSIVCLVLM